MTLTPEQIAAGWLPHDGGECPVPLDSKPGVMFRDGEIIEPGNETARTWVYRGDWWKRYREGRCNDIIAYLPEKNDG